VAQEAANEGAPVPDDRTSNGDHDDEHPEDVGGDVNRQEIRAHNTVSGSVSTGFVVQASSGAHFNIYQAGRDKTFSEQSSLASERQKLFFEFVRQALRQSETTFRLSVIFMSGGAAIILAGGILALIHAGNPHLGYVPVVTSLTGALITTGGGALAIHSNRARKHLTEQAHGLDMKIEEDHRLEKASVLIDRVQDQGLKDRLHAMTAIRTLGMSPDPKTVTNRVLPEHGGPAGEIGQGTNED
jgi:hypothetical protein